MRLIGSIASSLVVVVLITACAASYLRVGTVIPAGVEPTRRWSFEELALKIRDQREGSGFEVLPVAGDEIDAMRSYVLEGDQVWEVKESVGRSRVRYSFCLVRERKVLWIAIGQPVDPSES
jgi:hypothetical protein